MENNIVPKHSQDVVIDDASHPRALVNMVPDAMKNAIGRLPIEYQHKSEPQLKVTLVDRGFKLDATDHRLRFMFWKEYERAVTNGGRMQMVHVYSGICSREYWHVVLTSKERVAWLMCPPIDYVIAAEEALVFGIEQLRDILTLPHTYSRRNPETKAWEAAIDAKAAGVKVEIIKLLDLRVKGAVIQTTRNLNVNVSPPKPETSHQASPEDLDKRINEIEASLRQLGSSSNINETDIIEDAEVSE
jgi:hypothetical protein